jgi:DICT domain-containing protein
MTEKCFNPEIYNMASQAGATDEKGGPISTGVISFTPYEFEDFMTRFVRYVQNRQYKIIKDDKDSLTYMGNDTPSYVLISELEKSLIGEKNE